MVLNIDEKGAELIARSVGGFVSGLFWKSKKPQPVVFVTPNISKLNEYRDLLGIEDLMSIGYDFRDASDVSIEALVKRKLKLALVQPDLKKIPFFIEVTGLEISAWNGLPGALTTHFMEQVDCDGICKMMHAYKNGERTAFATTALLFSNCGEVSQMIVGRDEGVIATEPRGNGGFRWDKIFIPKGFKKTYAELGQVEKNKRSSRKQAADKLAVILRNCGLL